jgi:hypothetical protein
VTREDLLKLDYERTASVVAMLTDVRFKLLALVPTISGVGVAVAEGRSEHQSLAIGVLGTLATLGVLIYELRNTDMYDAALHRAKWLERQLGMRFSSPHAEPGMLGGVYGERPSRRDHDHPDPRFAFGLTVWHDMGLALVYSAAMTGWGFVVSSSGFEVAGVAPETARDVGLAGAALLGLLTWAQIRNYDNRKNKNPRSGYGENGQWVPVDALDRHPDAYLVSAVLRTVDAHDAPASRLERVADRIRGHR